MNPLQIYQDAGRKAGTAAKRRDMATVSHWNSWLSRAVALETLERRRECREAYNEAYREQATPTPRTV